MAMEQTQGLTEVICGSMFSGKTDELIRRLVRAQIAKQHVQVFKPAIDMRYAEGKVTSHAGLDLDAVATCAIAASTTIRGRPCTSRRRSCPMRPTR